MPALTPAGDPLILAAVELGVYRSDQRDDVALVAKSGGATPRDIIDDAHHADDDRGIDARATGVVVEADVAAHHRDVQCPARVADAVDGVVQVPPDVGVLGIGEIEAIGDRGRFRACGDDIASRLADGDHRPLASIECRVARVAVGGERQPERGAVDADQRGVAAREDHRRVADLVVVAAVHGLAAAEVGAAQQREERLV